MISAIVKATTSDLYLQKHRDIFFLSISICLSLYVMALVNPFQGPVFDDAAIIMRYLKNFQTGHFFVYNLADGPVYGVSGFIFGLLAGALLQNSESGGFTM